MENTPTTAPVLPGTPKKKRRARLEKTYWGYIFIAPFFIVYLIFSIYPLLTTFYYSTTDKSTFSNTTDTETYNHVGLDNFYKSSIESVRTSPDRDDPTGKIVVSGSSYVINVAEDGTEYVELVGGKIAYIVTFNGTAFVDAAGKEWVDTRIDLEGLEPGTRRAFQYQTSGALGLGTYRRIMLNTPLLWVMGFVPQMAIALLLAAWFTDVKAKVRGQGFFKVIFYMPNIMTAATIGAMFVAFINRSGIIHQLAVFMGIIEPSDMLSNIWFARGIIAFINWWLWFGNSMIVLIAGILGINPSLMEAARIDGANGVTLFWRVTVPLIKPILTFTLVQSLIGGFQMYDVPRIMSNSGEATNFLPGEGTNTVMTYIMRIAFDSPSADLGLASAMAVVLFLATVICSIVIFALMKDRSEEKWLKKQKKLEKLQGQVGGIA